jgi:hypothetical protein
MLAWTSGLGGKIRNDLPKFGIVIRWIDPTHVTYRAGFA